MIHRPLILSNDDNKPIKDWLPYIIGMTATAMLSALGAELIKWGIEELRGKYGSKRTDNTQDETT